MIGTYDYRISSEIISESYNLGQEALFPLICMYNKLQETDINPNQRHRAELQSYLRTTYSFIVLNHLNNQKATIDVMNALGKHVLDNYGSLYGYQNLDEFLLGQFLNVPLSYALLSRQTDYPITIISDENSSYEDINIPWGEINIPFDRLGSPFTVGSASARFQEIEVPWEEVEVPFEKIGWHNV